MLFILFLSLTLVWVNISLITSRINAVHVVFGFMSIQVLAVYNSSIDALGAYPTVIFLSGMLAFLSGINIVIKCNGKKNSSINSTVLSINNSTKLSLIIFSLIVLIGVAYHFYIAGVPAFSSDILTARFDNASSGFWGVPGRFKLFGVFFLFFLISAYRSRFVMPQRTLKLLWWGALFLLLIVQILTGSKGSVLNFVIALILVSPYVFVIKNNKVQYSWNNKRIIISVFVGLIVFFIIGNKFIEIGAYDHRDIHSVSDLFVRRLFYMSGESFVVSIDTFLNIYGFGYGGYFVSDLFVFASKFGLIDTPSLTTVQKISILQTGVNINMVDFIVPVTISAFGYLYIEFGMFGVLTGGLFLGWLFGYTLKSAMCTNSALKRSVFITLQLFFIWLMEKGNLGYWIPNIFFSMLLLVVAFLISRYISSIFFTRKKI